MKRIFLYFYKRIRHLNVREEIFELIPYDVLASLAFHKISGLFKGLVSFRKVVFRGNHVKITGKRYLQMGSFVNIGDNVRIQAFSKLGCRLGNAVTIDDSTVMRCSGAIREIGIGIDIGARTSIGLRNYLHGGGGIEIGEDCLVGPDVKIISANHSFSHSGGVIREQSDIPGKVIIGSNVWIGAGSTILSGVKIESHSIIAAGSVVTKDVSFGTLVAGVPARFVRSIL
jgi:acetyltransferase-like isoleucine patch superfamily enzyme